MAVFCPVGVGASRSGTFQDPAQSWTRSFWVRCTSIPDDSLYQQINVLWSNDAYASANIWFGVHGTGGGEAVFELNVYNGSDIVDVVSPAVVVGVDYFVAIRYDQGDQAVSLVVTNQEIDDPFIDLSALSPLPSDMIGTDTTSDAVGGVVLSRVRVWQAFLEVEELREEQGSPTAVRTANLLADTSLNTASDLADTSGNSRDWSAIGTLITADSPVAVPVALVSGVRFLSTDSIYARSQLSDGTLTGGTFIPGGAEVGATGIRVNADATEYYVLTSQAAVGAISVYDGAGTLLRTIVDPDDRAYRYLTVMPNGHILVAVRGETIALEVTPGGTFVHTYEGFEDYGIVAMSVVGTTVYYTNSNLLGTEGTGVQRYDLTTESPLPPLIAGPVALVNYFRVIGLMDDGAVISQPSADASPKLQRLDSDGNVLWSQNFDADAGIGAIALDTAGVVWAIEHNRADAFITTPARLFRVDLASGDILSTITLSQVFDAGDLDFIDVASPVVGGLTVTCSTKRVIVTGENFSGVNTITLTRNGTPIAFSVVSTTSTEIVLSVPTFTTGTFCVTVTAT